MVDLEKGSTLASTPDAHRKRIAVYPNVYGGILARNKKIEADPDLLPTEPKPVDVALAELQARVIEVLEGLPHGGAARAATVLGVDPSRLTEWKKGRELPLSYLPLFPEVFGVSAAWLLTGEPDNEAEGILLEIEKLLARRFPSVPGEAVDTPGGPRPVSAELDETRKRMEQSQAQPIPPAMKEGTK